MTATSAPGPAPGDRGDQHDGGNEEDEGHAALGERERSPSAARRRRWPGRGECVAAGGAFSIHGHRRARRNLLDLAMTRTPPRSVAKRARLLRPRAGISAARSGHGRRLAVEARQGLVDPGPLRRRVRPDRGAGAQQFGVVERAVAHDHEVRPCLRRAEHVRAAAPGRSAGACGCRCRRCCDNP